MALFRKRPEAGELADQAALRQKIYRVQAAAFLDTPEETLIVFLKENYPFLFSGEEAEDLKALRVDYTSLFMLSGHPYEAALIDESGHLNSAATDRVTDFYRSCGFDPGRESGGAKHMGLLAMDHLSVELEFLAHLAGEEEEAWRAGESGRAEEALDRAARFMDAHLLRWMPLFTAAAEEDAETEFYRGLSKWTREFALEDRKHIEKVLKAG